jgi:hypothetical protein
MTAGTYQLVVDGELDARFATLFEGMTFDWPGPTTVLTGDVTDQATLYGLLERIEELGLELVSIRRIAS